MTTVVVDYGWGNLQSVVQAARAAAPDGMQVLRSSSPDDVKRVSDHIASFGLKIGSMVAPIWGGAGGGSAMGSPDDRKRFLDQVRKACVIGWQMRDLGIRPTGGVRIDSSTGVEDWDKDPVGGTKMIAESVPAADA